LTKDNRYRNTDTYDRVIKKHQSTETYKITNGVCGSRHTINSGFVFSPKLDARRQYWVGLKAFDQEKNLTASGGYAQTNAQLHKMRVTVWFHPVDGSSAEIIQEYDLSGGEGIKYIFFDIDRVGDYIVVVKNQETGNCDGGECGLGTSSVSDLTSDLVSIGLGSILAIRAAIVDGDTEISNCWYHKIVLDFTISQEELDRMGKGEPIDVEDINNQLDSLNNGDSPSEPHDNTPEKILIGGLSLSAILLFISFLKS